MRTFELYIHGTPNGHQIWGSEKNHDYINTFYNHDTSIADKWALQIDICGGDSYYTYIHQQNVYDSNERPGAFFAITVCFNRSYCTNVYNLHKIFEAVYNQVCIGNIVSQKQNKEIYLVSDFKASMSSNIKTVDKIYAIFDKNIGELIEPYLISLGNIADTFNKTKKQYSLPEVDSPLFFDFFKKQSIIVLPSLEPSIISNQTLVNQLNIVNAQKKALETANSQLQLDKVALTNENKNLSNQLHASSVASEKKYSSSIKQLKADLKAVTQERNDLKAKIEEAKSTVELIDKPIQKLSRLLAGRFPNSDETIVEIADEISQKSSSKNSNKIWQPRFNRILFLGIAIILCFVILYFVVSKTNVKINDAQENMAEQTTSNSIDSKFSEDNSGRFESLSRKSEIEKESDIGYPQYDNWSNCKINIVNGGDTIEKGREYTLNIKKQNFRDNANVPQGVWHVEIGHTIINKNGENSFTILDNVTPNTKILIKYIVDDKSVIDRTVTVK